MSSKGNKKEVKKSSTNLVAPAQQSTLDRRPLIKSSPTPAAPTSNLMKTVSPTKKVLGQIRKRTSRMHNEASAVQEASVNEDEDISLLPSTAPSTTNLASPPTSGISPPPTFHYTAVTVKVDPDCFGLGSNRTLCLLTSNMVVGTVNFDTMNTLISGDQIATVDGTPVWHRDHLYRVLIRRKNELRLVDPKRLLDVTLIRPYNIEPPSTKLLQRTELDERFMYFVVTMSMKNLQGFATRFDKKRLIVSKIRATTAPSYALLIGDQLLAIDDFIIPSKGSRKSCLAQVKTMWTAIKSHPTVRIFACRPISARSSPCPSVDAELIEKFPNSIKGMEKREEKGEEINVPLDGDALEIAFRELVCLQQSIRPGLPLPYTCKGKSLLKKPPGVGATPAAPAAPNPLSQSTSGTNVSAAASQDRSMYMPVNSSAASTMSSATAGTPRKRWSGAQRQTKRVVPPVKFNEPAETTKITSDIAEEAELKKCDPRSGIVAYIKNAFNN